MTDEQANEKVNDRPELPGGIDATKPVEFRDMGSYIYSPDGPDIKLPRRAPMVDR